MRAPLLAAFLAPAMLLATPGAPQVPPRGPGSVAGSVEVSVTNLDVVVVDSSGSRVPGLTREDFEVREGGRTQPITNFSEVRRGVLVMASGGAPGLPPAVPADPPATAPPRTRMIVFVDNASLAPADRVRVLTSVRDFLSKSLNGTTEVMAVSWGLALHVHQAFTTNAGEVRRALERIEGEAAGGALRASRRRELIREIDDIVSGLQPGGDVGARTRAYCDSLQAEIRGTLAALQACVERLAGLEGRKVLLIVTQGLPQSPGLEIWKYIDDALHGKPNAALKARDYDLTSTYEDLVRAANAAGVTLYTVDATGLGVDASVSADSPAALARLDGSLDRSNLQSMERSIAEQTGGSAIVNANDVSTGLAEVAEDGTSYYSVGYLSTGGALDRPRTIAVTVKRKGLVARSRRSLVEKSARARVTEAVRSALYLPRGDNPLDLTLDVGGARRAAGGTVVVSVRFGVPWSRLSIPGPGKSGARLSLFVAALDEEARETEVMSQEMSPQPAPGEPLYHLELSLSLRPGKNRLSIALRDEVSGLVSFAQKALAVPR